jgi:hypothetical protein
MISTDYRPRQQSATIRRTLRRDLRQALGTGKDPAPSARAALRAAHIAADLVWYATNGRLKLRLEDASGNFVHFRDAIGSASADSA